MNPSDLEQIAGTVTLVEALRYRSLRYVKQSLAPFQVLIGPNASGKSTFLDVFAFFGDLLRAGLEGAVMGDARLSVPERAPDARHLAWMRKETRIELAIEVGIPLDRRERLSNGKADVCRYEIAFDVDGPLRLSSETLWLKPLDRPSQLERRLFPDPLPPRETIIVSRPNARMPSGWKKVIARSAEAERVTFFSEAKNWNNPFRLDAGKAALMSLPDDEDKFPVASWFRQFILDGVQRVVLSSEAMRRPSPSARSLRYLPDGSNLPWAVFDLEKRFPERHRDWIEHVKRALPDIETITTREREIDRYRYLVVKYRSGLEAPSWLISDGTLRLLALTLFAYLPEPSGIFLIEEPENGIHPRAVETIFESVSSVYGAQVLLATHSPVILSMAKPSDLLCFARSPDGATDIIRGNEHPRLKEWKGSVDLGQLFGSGILG